ncbi:uncharacterized protein LOC127861876 [Dreissena polymorpha]|uniref:Uncharacterized protein n=1 Tax=Dreissena polymorpha TaxID=45954 RepID=A0A9D3Y8A9_DREPO|nr:uncharacterized protein LOC127861876 [Dreissena polymorpha]KAH3693722.1 hypothetical protein DPMN_081162 [Dreissena polymorpha]
MTGYPIPRPTHMHNVAIGDQGTRLSSELRSFLTHEYLEKIRALVQPDEFTDVHLHNEDEEALRLEREVRVLCWIMTSPKNLNPRQRPCDARGRDVVTSFSSSALWPTRRFQLSASTCWKGAIISQQKQ